MNLCKNWSLYPRSSFTTSRNQTFSYVEYYKKHYDIDIQNLKQPLLISKPKRKAEGVKDFNIALIPELCYLTGMPDLLQTNKRAKVGITLFQ